VSTLTFGELPSIEEANYQVEIGKRVSSSNLLDLTRSTENASFVRRLGDMVVSLEKEVVDGGHSLSEETRERLERAALDYFSESSKSKSSNSKVPLKGRLIGASLRVFLYGAIFRAVITDKLDELYEDIFFLREAVSNLMHSILDAVEEQEESDMAAFLNFLEKDIDPATGGNCIPYTQEMSDEIDELLMGVEVG
jgi:hypothetical protein